LNILSVVTAKGEFDYDVTEQRINSKEYIEFLKQLIKDRDRPLFLIVDRASFHRSKQVRTFIWHHRRKRCCLDNILDGYNGHNRPFERFRHRAGMGHKGDTQSDALLLRVARDALANSYLWAMLLPPLFEGLPPVCLQRGADMRIVAFITEAAAVERILTHIGVAAQRPPIAPARALPAWDDALADAVPDWDALAQPEPESLFDQQVQW
jgi:hypothetical protein